MVKLVLYCVMVFISMWALECLRMEHIFKKGRQLQIKVVYILFSLSIAYLVTNFLYDFAFHTNNVFF